MKIKFGIWLLVVLLIPALIIGCAQPASNAEGQITVPTAGTADQSPAPAAVNTGQGTTPPRAAENTTFSPPVEKNDAQLMKISDILQNHKEYSGKTVVVQGKIATECPSGCWFTLKDGNAVIYIDLLPSNMVIPQRKGSNARVTAEVVSEGSDVYLVGKKVEF